MILPPLTTGRLQRRYKRFFADVVLDDGREVTAHCPNTGRMTSCLQPGCHVQVSHSDNPRRKLQWTLERTDVGGGWIGVHTGRVNQVIAEAVTSGAIPTLAGYQQVTPEVAVAHDGQRARIDLVLSGAGQQEAWVEVKNATLLQGSEVCFPDAPTARGLKHLDVLATQLEQGRRAVLVFAINRPEGCCFVPADEVDPQYGKRLRQVVALGVEVVAPQLVHQSQSIEVSGELPVVLGG